MFKYIPSNLPIWPIGKLAGQSANHTSRFENGTTNLKIFLKYRVLSFQDIQCYLIPYFFSNLWCLLKYLILNVDIRHKLWHETSISSNCLLWKIFTDMTMVRISGYCLPTLEIFMLWNEIGIGTICKLDRFLDDCFRNVIGRNIYMIDVDLRRAVSLLVDLRTRVLITGFTTFIWPCLHPCILSLSG